MWITHSFIGTTRNGTRCLFFLLFEDYIEAQTQFARELDLELERFARNLGDTGAVVRPFAGDIESARKSVIDKGWSDRQKRELYKTPSILMIGVDFDEFDPRQHSWILLHLGRKQYEGAPGAYHFREALQAIAEAVNDSGADPFDVAHDVQHEVTAEDAVKVFEARPGAFGFSIDLVQAGSVLKNLYQRHRDV
jgi:hypothetical protein